MDASPYILSTILEGYKIPFLTTPPRSNLKNNRSALENQDFVIKAIDELLSGNCISETTPQSIHNINPLSVAVQPCGKKRLILDLRLINQHLRKYKFKYEDYRKALVYFAKGSYTINFDLMSGYYHIDICGHHRKYLGFSWTFPDGTPCFFVFNVLTFGLSTAPYIFTKLLRPLIKLWRAGGLNCVVHLDDGIAFENSFEQASLASHHMKGDLEAAGFVVNDQKSTWTPVREINWLGITWYCESGAIAIKQSRIAKAINIIECLLSKTQVLARVLSKFVGSIMSMSAVLGRLSRINE